MNRDWAAVDDAVSFAIGVDDMWRARAKGYINRAVDAFMADGMKRDGPDYEQFIAAMDAYSTLRLHRAAKFPSEGGQMASAAAELGRGLAESQELLADLGSRMRAEGREHVAALADEMAGLAADIADGL